MKVAKKTRWGIPALVFVLALGAGLVLAGCDIGGNPSNPFVGTWTGYDTDGDVMRLVVASSTWTISWPGYLEWGVVSGTYTYSGNTATFFLLDVAFGTGTVSGNTMTMTVTGDGPMFLARQ